MITRKRLSFLFILAGAGWLGLPKPATASLMYITGWNKTNNICNALNVEFPNTNSGACPGGGGLGGPANSTFDYVPSTYTSPNSVAGFPLVNNGVDFMLKSNASGFDFAEIPVGSTLTVNVGASNVTNVYLLMGAYGPLAPSFVVQFNGTGGATQTFTTSVPDFCQNHSVNDSPQAGVTRFTTFQVNDVGACATGNSRTGLNTTYNITEVAFALSSAFLGQTLNSFTITPQGSNKALLYGVTAAVTATLSVNRKVLNYGISGSLITSPQTVLVTIAGGTNVAWTVTSDHSNITVNPPSGVGTNTFQITASQGSSGIVTVTAPGATNSPQTIQVNVASVTPALPFGSFDTPIDNTTGVVGAIPVTGWALGNIEVTRVDVLREPVVGEPAGNLIFIGTAVFSADARPDVAAMFPTLPFQYRAGWGYQMLTNFLPNASGSGPSGNGTYKLHAIAFDSAGNQQDLGTKTITVDNAHAAKPFGTIDTPGQGGTVSGASYVNFGWALTPQPAMIPTDGSTITVVLDGVLMGHPTYNNFRSDIASLFPGYANSMGAVGYYYLDTTKLANGVHTISWNVFDNQGRGEGVGSRYFNVLNTGGGAVAAPEDVIDESVAKEGVWVRHGLDVNRRPEQIWPDGDGSYSVTMEEVGHIELYVGAARGNMLVLGEAQALPIGSTLKDGVFYWQPGPGFLGEYTMQFERPDESRIPVRVNIVPKRYE